MGLYSLQTAMTAFSTLVDDIPSRWDEVFVVLPVNDNDKPLSTSHNRQYPNIAFKCVLIATVCIASTSFCHGLIPAGKFFNYKLRPHAPSSSWLHVVEAELPVATVSTTRTEGAGVLPLDFKNGVVTTDIACSMEDAAGDNDDEEATISKVRNSSSEDGQEDSEATADSEKSSDALDDAVKRRLETTAKAAALADRRRRRGDASTESKAGRNTSVGPRRGGSATKARSRLGSIDRLTDAIRKGSTSSSVGNRNSRDLKERNPPQSMDVSGTSSQNSFFGPVNKSTIHAAVAEMLDPSGSLGIRPKSSQDIVEDDYAVSSTPEPGAVLIPAVSNKDRRTTFGKRAASDRLTVRLATRFDDFDIANLRLSVFSNFTPAVRKTFCSKSCQLLASRRRRGATCIVATVPRYGAILSPRQDIILGSAECSFHEFHGTTLGASRPQDSILYVTEVAVSPTARRQGIGMKMMQVRTLPFPFAIFRIGANEFTRIFVFLLLQQTCCLLAPLV